MSELLTQEAIDYLKKPSPLNIYNPSNNVWIGVVRFFDGKVGVIKSTMPAKVIAVLNSEGCNNIYKDKHSIAKIIGIKDVTEERTLESVVKKMQKHVGVENVYSIDTTDIESDS